MVGFRGNSRYSLLDSGLRRNDVRKVALSGTG
jgi:hypothetical protein